MTTWWGWRAIAVQVAQRTRHGLRGHGKPGHIHNEEALYATEKPLPKRGIRRGHSKWRGRGQFCTYNLCQPGGFGEIDHRIGSRSDARALPPKRSAGLEAFLAKHGGEEALAIMLAVLWRHTFDGKPVGSVKSWRFFEKIVTEERNKPSLESQGIRPGDLMASHQHFIAEPLN